MEHAVPPGLDPTVTRREIVIKADAETLEERPKEGHAKVRNNAFTIYCDEEGKLGGDDSAPPSLASLRTALAF